MQSRFRITLGASCASLVLLAGVTTKALAEQVIFTLQSATVTVSGTDSVYGALGQQGAGSLQTTGFGHFLVDFDPFSGAPTSLSFLFDHGYMSLNNNGDWLPGPNPAIDVGSQTTAAPANYAVQTPGGTVKIAARNAAFDFRNLTAGSPIAVSTVVGPSLGSFDITQLGAKNLGGGVLDFFHPDYGGYGTLPATGTAEFISGTASLVETATGVWTMTLAGDAQGSYGAAPAAVGAIIYHSEVVATAQFSTANVDPISSTGATSGSALGGATTTGGVDVGFANVTTPGTLNVQQINTSGLSQNAVAAATSVANFKTAGNTPQIWDVSFGGSFTGPLTLTFAYDDTQLGVAEENLFLWHFDEGLNEWEQIFGTVDTDLNTITISANSLSPFALGVPEPSSLCLLALGALGLGIYAWRRGPLNKTRTLCG